MKLSEQMRGFDRKDLENGVHIQIADAVAQLEEENERLKNVWVEYLMKATESDAVKRVMGENKRLREAVVLLLDHTEYADNVSGTATLPKEIKNSLQRLVHD